MSVIFATEEVLDLEHQQHQQHQELLPEADLFAQDHLAARMRPVAALLFPAADVGTISYMQDLLHGRDSWLSEADRSAMVLQASQGDDAPAGLTQRLFGIEHLPAVLRHCQGRLDHYLSQHSYSRQAWRRGSDAVHQLTSCYVDLDCLDVGMEPLAAARAALQQCEAWDWPTPGVIVSGRGVHLKWRFSHFLPGQAAPRWRALQQALQQSFESLGADPKAKDAARVLRVVGTLNSKAVPASPSALAERLAKAQQAGPGQGEALRRLARGECFVLHVRPAPVSFDELCGKVLLQDRLSAADRVAVKSLRAAWDKRVEASARPRRQRPGAGSWYDRLEGDLLKLAALRGHKLSGHREFFLHLLLNCARGSGRAPTPEAFEAEAQRFAGLLAPGAAEAFFKELYPAVASDLARGVIYRWSVETLRERLQVTQQELQQLDALAGKRVPELAARDEEILRLKDSGLKKEEIAGLMGLSVRHVKRVIASQIQFAT